MVAGRFEDLITIGLSVVIAKHLPADQRGLRTAATWASFIAVLVLAVSIGPAAG